MFATGMSDFHVPKSGGVSLGKASLQSKRGAQIDTKEESKGNKRGRTLKNCWAATGWPAVDISTVNLGKAISMMGKKGGFTRGPEKEKPIFVARKNGTGNWALPISAGLQYQDHIEKK